MGVPRRGDRGPSGPVKGAVFKIMHGQEALDHVERVVEGMAADARADLLGHRDTGKAHIETRHKQGRFRTNSEVHLVDPGDATLSIEFGHLARDGSTWVEGLHILGRLIGADGPHSYLKGG